MKTQIAFYRKIGWLLSVLSLSSCGPINLTGEPRPEVRALDGVKLISPEIVDAQSESSFSQDQYEISGSRRLLLRFNKLDSEVDSVQVTESSRVELLITVASSGNPEVAKEAISACPITRNWMMLATWENAHPFNRTGRWTTPGGDYESSGCVKANKIDQRTLTFDVSQWFLDYPRARRANFGLILVSNQALQISGESSGSYSPRLVWKEF